MCHMAQGRVSNLGNGYIDYKCTQMTCLTCSARKQLKKCSLRKMCEHFLKLDLSSIRLLCNHCVKKKALSITVAPLRKGIGIVLTCVLKAHIKKSKKRNILLNFVHSTH